MVRKILFTAGMAASVLLPSLPASAREGSTSVVAYQCKGYDYFNPYLDDTNKADVRLNKTLRELAKTKDFSIAVRGNTVEVVGVNWPGPMSMDIAQRGTSQNGWTFVKLVQGVASNPVHVFKIKSYMEAGRKGPDGTLFYPFAYSVDNETTYGLCKEV